LVLNGFQSLSKYKNVTDSTKTDEPGEGPVGPRETFFTKMLKKFEDKVPRIFKDEE
jgi:hypothetical protein